ncbi:MAG: penicillin-binding protein 2 [Gammaproteobacteria bacterium]|nr:penicillin-binding protein 2 [Gammaproteobacteria bacterium]
MPRRVHIKNDHHEKQLIKWRLVLSALLVFAMLCIIAVRLYVLQILDHQHFTTLADSNRVHIKALPPTRGLIFDRNGLILANNIPSYRLELTKEELEDFDSTILRLKNFIEISDQDIKKYKQSSRRRRPFESVPLRFNLSDKEVSLFAVNQHLFAGVQINARLTRNYPQKNHAVHILGYVSRIDENDLKILDSSNYSGTTHIGKTGIEKFYEEELHGTVGIQQVEVNAKGRILRVLKETPPLPGQNLFLNIDSELQRVAEKAFDGEKGALVAINPQNGEVLALVSLPTFDPNLFVNRISYKDYNYLRNSKHQPLFNRALSGQYPPGSTTKPFFALLGLEESISSANKKINCKGHYQLQNDDHKYRDWKKTGHGKMNMDQAITQSCDVYFYDLSFRTGIDRMSAFMKQFGFGSRTGIDSTGERPGLMPSREWKRSVRREPWFPGETLITGIGQGALLATPLQLASATSALTQNGQVYKPHLVHSIEYPNNADILDIKKEPSFHYKIKSQRNLEHILKGMEHVVHHHRGTAFYSIGKNSDYKLAGKTGTAQVFGIAQEEEYKEEDIKKKLRDHALFIGFAPLKKPNITIAIIVENGGHGSSTAAPIAKKVMDVYLAKNKIKVTDE